MALKEGGVEAKENKAFTAELVAVSRALYSQSESSPVLLYIQLAMTIALTCGTSVAHASKIWQSHEQIISALTGEC